MSSSFPNEPAFPSSVMRGQDGNYWTEDDGGLTKREYFAALIAAGMCASECEGSYFQDAKLATRAVVRADALIAELAKAQP